jgi:hypothetical protein
LSVQGRDFFESVVAGGDAYILKRVIHDWDDERATRILEWCRQAMPATGRLLVVETVIPPGNEPSWGLSGKPPNREAGI